MSEWIESRAGARQLAALVEARYDEFVLVLMEAGRRASPGYITSIGDEQLHQRAKLTLDAYTASLVDDPPTAYADCFERLGFIRFSSGVPLKDMLNVVLACNAAMRQLLSRALAGDPIQQAEVAERCAVIGESGILGLHVAYEMAKDNLIKAQQARIMQLSTPIIPVHQGTLVVPLIGSLDADRMGEMIGRLLDGISRAKAAVVIIDITGVPVVDTEVAGHLIRAARAANLLGAKAIFVGIRPAIAQALVQLGADLGGLTTLANLQAGIEHALHLQGLAIGPRGVSA